MTVIISVIEKYCATVLGQTALKKSEQIIKTISYLTATAVK